MGEEKRMSKLEKTIWTIVTIIVTAGTLILQSQETLSIFKIPVVYFGYVAAVVDVVSLVSRNVYLKLYNKKFEI